MHLCHLGLILDQGFPTWGTRTPGGDLRGLKSGIFWVLLCQWGDANDLRGDKKVENNVPDCTIWTTRPCQGFLLSALSPSFCLTLSVFLYVCLFVSISLPNCFLQFNNKILYFHILFWETGLIWQRCKTLNLV